MPTKRRRRSATRRYVLRDSRIRRTRESQRMSTSMPRLWTITHVARSATPSRARAVPLLTCGPGRLRRLPAAAERLVEVHDRNELIALGLCEGVLCRIEQLQGVQHLDVIREARLVPGERQPHGLLERDHLRFLRPPLFGEPRLPRQPVRPFPEPPHDRRPAPAVGP